MVFGENLIENGILGKIDIFQYIYLFYLENFAQNEEKFSAFNSENGSRGKAREILKSPTNSSHKLETL